MAAFGASRAATVLSSASSNVAECTARRPTTCGKILCPRAVPLGVGAAGAVRRPRTLGHRRRDCLVTRAVSDGEAVDKGVSSLQNLGLDDIGIDVDELSRGIGIVDSSETMSLNKEFAIHGFVRVTDGRGGLPKVTLTHPSGSFCDVYLHGANILSWVMANGGEVFYAPDGIAFSESEPIRWGTPFCFPQFGEGGERAGSPPGEHTLPVDGFAKDLKWNIQQTGLRENIRGEYPYVTIEISDTEATRAVWNHNFNLVMEISLEHAAINVSTQVTNTGSEDMEYAAAFKSHVAVADVLQPSTTYVGLEDCIYLDNTLHPTKPRVRFTDDAKDQEWVRLEGPTDRVYLNTKNDTGVEVGTGCTVFARNMCAAGVDGFGDRAVFNPWKDGDADNYRWYAGLAIGTIAKLVKVGPMRTHKSKMRFEIMDMIMSKTLKERKEKYQKHEMRKMTQRPTYDLLVDDLPTDLQ